MYENLIFSCCKKTDVKENTKCLSDNDFKNEEVSLESSLIFWIDGLECH